jgi:hypothetical protein
MNDLTEHHNPSNSEAQPEYVVAVPDPLGPPPVFQEPGAGPADAVHLQATVVCLDDEGRRVIRRRTVCGAAAPFPTGIIMMHDDTATCMVCLAHRYDRGVSDRLTPVRSVEAPPPLMLRADAWLSAVLP